MQVPALAIPLRYFCFSYLYRYLHSLEYRRDWQSPSLVVQRANFASIFNISTETRNMAIYKQVNQEDELKEPFLDSSSSSSLSNERSKSTRYCCGFDHRTTRRIILTQWILIFILALAYALFWFKYYLNLNHFLPSNQSYCESFRLLHHFYCLEKREQAPGVLLIYIDISARAASSSI